MFNHPFGPYKQEFFLLVFAVTIPCKFEFHLKIKSSKRFGLKLNGVKP